MKTAKDLIVTNPDQLPISLGTSDVMRLVRCCRATAVKIIRAYEASGNRVLWTGEKRPEPRLNRDAFLGWFGGTTKGAS